MVVTILTYFICKYPYGNKFEFSGKMSPIEAENVGGFSCKFADSNINGRDDKFKLFMQETK